MSLSLIEKVFQAFLISENPDIVPFIEQDNKLGAQKRLRIYYDAYRFRLLEILNKDYPKLCRLMGNDEFHNLGHSYIAHYPSRYFSVRHLGSHLSEFLLKHKDYLVKPYLYEMAQFEWALGEVVDTPDLPLVSLEELKQLNLQQFAWSKVKLHPSVLFFYFHWNIPELWLAMEQHVTSCTPTKLEVPNHWMIFRKGLDASFRSLEATEALALKLLSSGHSFAALCDKLCESLDEKEIPKYLVTKLQQWLQEGLISGIYSDLTL